ncbi:MAG: 2-oxo acid dehydrogenase subunit E2 [Chlamydiales bacterium]|nr:2-oxo acid dehydrogenase subunit E2 [Chlamydiales bacterium]
MKVEIKVPSMGESITEATIGRILKENGSHIVLDEELVELETEKATQILYAPVEGDIFYAVKENDTVKVGDVIGFIEETKALHKQIESIPVVKEEAKRSIKHPMSPIRKFIASKLILTKEKTAMLTTFNEVDMSKIIEMKNSYKELFEKEHKVHLGYMSFFAKATVEALKMVPILNASIEGEFIVQRNDYDIGIAVSTDRGVVVPVIRNCDIRSFAEIERDLDIFAKQACEGIISADAFQGGSFTITNGGVFGSLFSTPILNGSQSGILGMHKIEKRVVVIDDQIVIRPMMYLALTYDHRLVDGKEAITFLVHIKEALEDPARLFLGI